MENSESLRVGLDTSDAEVAFSPICSSAPVTISDSDGMTCVVTTKITTVSEVLFLYGFRFSFSKMAITKGSLVLVSVSQVR